jgi:hypothetical protein
MKREMEHKMRETGETMPAYNWRFGASGGVAPRKVQWEYER